MARYTGPACKLCRREGVKLFLKGDRCYSDKCPIEKGAALPGKNAKSFRPRKPSTYGVRIREKQKLRKYYGLLEKQFKAYFKKAERKKGITGENLIELLERRLDNIMYRTGIVKSRAQARQLVLHSHILVNGKKVNIPSYQVNIDDTIEIKEKSKNIEELKEIKEGKIEVNVSSWIEFIPEQLKGKVIKFPSKEELNLPIEEKLVVEYYSR
ncbi:MAG: 30S ribosomal protein S4 [Candidatus Caldatribacteriota bacterium]|nr:30S ribosomal protein S4 [Candidatus Caldatribacteriota bacterium]